MARRKVTKGEGDIPDLTPDETEFIANILSGMNQTQAFKAVKACNHWKDTSIRVEASKLRHKPNVSLALDNLMAEAQDAARCSREDHLKELARLRVRSETSGNYGAAVQAEQLRGKVAGHYVEQVRDVTQPDPLRTLDEIAQHSPELAEKLAQENGIQWKPETKH